MEKYFYGLAGDLVSDDDLSLEYVASSSTENPVLPTKWDMMNTDVKNQGQCGSCTAHGATICHEIQNNWEHKKIIILDAYKLWTKQVDNPLPSYKASCQNGDYISHAVDILIQKGSETMDGKLYTAKGKARVYDNTPYSLKKWLVQGYPLIVGITWYSEMFHSKTGQYQGYKGNPE
jgi:hypothetical protein